MRVWSERPKPQVTSRMFTVFAKALVRSDGRDDTGYSRCDDNTSGM